MPPGVPPQVARTGNRHPAGQQLRVPTQQRRGDRLSLRIEDLLIGGGKRRADMVGKALVRDPVHRHPVLAVLDDVPAQLIQHPGHLVTAEPPATEGAGAGQPLLFGESRAQSPGQRGQQDPRRIPSSAYLGQVGVERVLDRVAHPVLPARLGGVDRRGAQLVGDQPGQQERAASGHRRSPGQVPGHRARIHGRVHPGQPPRDIGAHVTAATLLRGRVIQVQLGGTGGQHVQQRRLGPAAAQLPGGDDHRRVRRQPQQQLLRDRKRVTARLVQPVHHDHRRRGAVLCRPLQLAGQLGGVPPVRLSGQHPHPHQLPGNQLGRPVRGKPPRVHVRGDRPHSRVGVPQCPALGQQPPPLGRVGQAHHPPGDRRLPRPRRPGDHVQARLVRPHPGHHLADLGGPPGEPGLLARRRATPGRQQQVLHHPLGRARVIPRVGEHPPRAAVAAEIRRMRQSIPGFQDRVAQVIAADELTLRRPPLHQQRPRTRPRLRAALQQPGQPPSEQPVPRHLLRKTRGQHPHPHMLTLRRRPLHDPRRQLPGGHRAPGKARVDDQQQLAGARLGTRGGHIAACPQSVIVIVPAVPRKQPQPIDRRPDRVAAPQQHQAPAAGQQAPQPLQVVPGRLLDGIAQDRALEGGLQQVGDGLHVEHGMLQPGVAVVILAHSHTHETRHRHRGSPLPTTQLSADTPQVTGTSMPPAAHILSPN